MLQQVTVQVQSNDECKRRYGKDAPGGIVDHMLCAAYPGKDSCSVTNLNTESLSNDAVDTSYGFLNRVTAVAR